jgi:O-antigen biosynthesis protein
MSKPDIVLLGHLFWEPRWQRPQHLVKAFLERGHRVIYVNPRLGHDHKDLQDRERQDSRLVVVELSSETSPFVLTAEPWSSEDERQAEQSFHALVDGLELKEVILFVQSPGWWPLVRRIAGVGVVYDCLDEHTGWNPVAAPAVRAAEEELTRSADLVLATARPLQQRLSELAWNVLLVPNGCDFTRFQEAATPNGYWRQNESRPIVGFFGSLGHAWFDVQLVLSAAAMRPDWRFILLGPSYGDVSGPLRGVENILLTGEVPYPDLPRLAADFDVAIIPWLVNDLTAATDPVKLWEYFAAGKPVVSTPLPELFAHQGLLDVVDDPSSFVDAVARFVDRPGDVQSRQALARRADWGSRVDLFYEEMLSIRGS